MMLQGNDFSANGPGRTRVGSDPFPAFSRAAGKTPNKAAIPLAESRIRFALSEPALAHRQEFFAALGAQHAAIETE
jgi:hypothetical protein